MSFQRLIEAIQHGLGHQSVGPQRSRHLDAGAVSECLHPVRQSPRRQKPRRDDHPAGAAAAQLVGASASDGSGRVANAVVAPAQRVPAASLGATAAVRAFAAGFDEPIATTSTPSVSSSRDTPNSATR